MGKRKLNEIISKYGSLESNPVANSHDITFEYKRAQKVALKNKKYKVRILQHLRRVRRDMIAQQRKKLKLVLFGYWKYWFQEGKIGPEEDNEPNLGHN